MGSSRTNETPSKAPVNSLSNRKERDKKHRKKHKKKKSTEQLSRKKRKGSEEERQKKKRKKEKKKEKKDKKRLKKQQGQQQKSESKSEEENVTEVDIKEEKTHPNAVIDDNIVQSSALDFVSQPKSQRDLENPVSLLLFYQYVEPPWDSEFYNRTVLKYMQHIGTELQLTGRMRVAREGANCTLTGTHDSILKYCQTLRTFHSGEFAGTEFKITRDLPKAQRFPSLKVMPVTELVHYGLEGEKAPSIAYTGVHLEPTKYHQKLAEENTVVIDVRNHYEAAIGHFDPPEQGAKWLDPKMRKSTEFPVWLDKPETKEQLRGKQVLMYCTGGVRCERASALLKYKMETERDTKDLGIKGVYQLQGGIDKYFKKIPDGGFWKGKNYVFDKRFAHAPPKIDGEERSGKVPEKQVLGTCEACGKPWDMYRGKRRCPTCGVPSLICRDCFQADKDGVKKIDRRVRCDLCVEQNVTHKAQIRAREENDLLQFTRGRMQKDETGAARLDTISASMTTKTSTTQHALAENPDDITRLFLRNMCRRNMDEGTLTKTLPGITHIVWKVDRKTGQFLGSGWIEMATADDAAHAVSLNGKRVLGRPLYITYQAPDGKDMWPPPHSSVHH